MTLTAQELDEIIKEADPETLLETVRIFRDAQVEPDGYARMKAIVPMNSMALRLLMQLMKSPGTAIHYDRLMLAMGVPNRETVAVAAHRLRTALKAHGVPAEVETLYDYSFRLIINGPVPWETGH
jgi:DNA-binding response OmpR family regulator